MTAPNANNTRPSAMRRYGPLIGIVVVVALVGGGIWLFSSNNDKKSTASTRNGASAKGLPLTYSEAKKQGKADSINWGKNCDTSLGTVKIPSVYAPDCVEPYDAAKGNGGATYSGVTGNEITVVQYTADPKRDPLLASQVSAAGADVSPESQGKTAQGFVDIYQPLFELSGRKVKLVQYVGTGSSTDEAAAKADALKVLNDYHPFAVFGAPSQTAAFRNEIAAAKVLCVGDCAGAVPQAQTEEFGQSTYFWPFAPSPEQASLETAQMVCTQFKGGQAVYGGDDVKAKDRVFGIAHYDTPTGEQRNTYVTLKNALQKCGVKVATDVSFFLDTTKSQETARTTISKLKDAGVTSVIFLGDPINPIYMTTEATAQSWFPEWIIGPTVYVDTAVFGRRYDQKQWAHAFGIGLPATRADQATQESYALYEWGLAKAPPSNLYSILNADVGLFMRGFMLAGPTLNPETFKAAMFRAPIAGGGPTTPRVSRGEHGLWPFLDLYGSDDATLVWWNPTATGTDDIGNNGTGLYEYANMGKRYTLKQWPNTPVKLFDPSNSVTVFKTLPPEDQPPDYPSPVR